MNCSTEMFILTKLKSLCKLLYHKREIYLGDSKEMWGFNDFQLDSS